MVITYARHVSESTAASFIGELIPFHLFLEEYEPLCHHGMYPDHVTNVPAFMHALMNKPNNREAPRGG